MERQIRHRNRMSVAPRTRASVRGLLSLGVVWAIVASTGAASACIVVCVGFSRGCPPNPYGQPQPPLDCDLDGDGMNDSWCVPITLPNPAGGNFPTTDSCGNTLSLPCVADNPPGAGGDHYRPTWKKPGETGSGTELGRCLYPCGRNTWTVGMCDTNGDGTPDKFMTSKWTTEDFKDTNNDGVWDTPTGKKKTFCVNIGAAASVQQQHMIIVATQYRDGDSAAGGVMISDAVVLPQVLTDLGDVVLDGQPLGVPIDNAIVAVAHMEQRVVDAVEVATRSDVVAEPAAARGAAGDGLVRFRGTVTNIDTVAHNYEVSFFGVNVVAPAEPIHLTIAAGDTAVYVVEAQTVGEGDRALATVAYSDLGDPYDAVVAVAVVEPPVRLGDLNGDNAVNGDDLALLLSAWGETGEANPADLNHDHVVNAVDLALLLGDWR